MRRTQVTRQFAGGKEGSMKGVYHRWVMRLRNGERWNFNKAKQSLRASKLYDPELSFVYGKLLKASHLIAGTLAERAVVIGDLSQRQMVIKKQEHETRKERNKRRIRNRMVYNDWGLYGFVQMLKYKCLRFGKELSIIDERDTTRTCHACKHQQDMPLWKRTYHCENCGLVMDRDENSAVNIYQRFVAGPPPHTQL